MFNKKYSKGNNMFATDPYAVAKFRENTNKDKNPGMCFRTFMCRKCHTPKSVTGRKRVSSNVKDGWMCAHCYEVREAKRAAKLAVIQDLASE